MEISYVTTRTYTLTLTEEEVYRLKQVLIEKTNSAGVYAAFAQSLNAAINKAVQVLPPPSCEPG